MFILFHVRENKREIKYKNIRSYCCVRKAEWDNNSHSTSIRCSEHSLTMSVHYHTCDLTAQSFTMHPPLHTLPTISMYFFLWVMVKYLAYWKYQLVPTTAQTRRKKNKEEKKIKATTTTIKRMKTLELSSGYHVSERILLFRCMNEQLSKGGIKSRGCTEFLINRTWPWMTGWVKNIKSTLYNDSNNITVH